MTKSKTKHKMIGTTMAATFALLDALGAGACVAVVVVVVVLETCDVVDEGGSSPELVVT